MKRITFLLMGIMLAALPLSAQNYRNSRYYNQRTGHLDYGYHQKDTGTPYFGFRIGPAFSYVNSDDKRLDGGNWQTGLNVGVVAGIPLSNIQPLYLEAGLSYIEKGGKKDLDNGKKMTYDLNYLEIPVVLKYKYNIDPHFSIQPQVGGYFGVGVGGKIKNFEERAAQNSFNENNFQRLDGGLRLGCGIAYDMFYCDLTYDIGLANICHDTFDTSHNGSLQLNFGVNF
nr:porin family protein [uncultured Prevotella sp.]